MLAIERSNAQHEALSVAEKLRLLEQVWQSLCSQPDSIASPDWHADVLMERRQRLLDGSATSLPWNEAEPSCGV